MCAFDKKPIWKENEWDKNRKRIECSGKHHLWYYLSLLVWHIYYLVEFIVRIAAQKYKIKYLYSTEAFVEIATSIPFLVTYFVYGTESVGFQVFVSIDCLRLVNYERITKYI